MKFDQIVENRRSTRSFESRPIENKDLIAIVEAARLAPSACNSQAWRFIAVTNRDTIQRICREAMRPVIPNRWLEQAPLIVIGCSELDIIANQIGTRVIGIEYYQIDLGIAMEHMVLKATELGIGTCWIDWFKEDKIKEILEIPKRIKVSVMLAVGFSKEDKPKKKGAENRYAKYSFLKNGTNPFTLKIDDR